MTSVANHALEKLLRRAENALAKGSANRVISINFTDKSFPAYLKLETFAEKEACNGELRLAERDGAIKVVWDERAGVEKHIGQIVLDDPVALAKFLGVKPRWVAVAEVEDKLSSKFEKYPVLKEVVAQWKIGKVPRGTTTENVNDWLDAVRVVEHCHSSDTLDIPVRRVSAKLTCDSKRVEGLFDVIDVLLHDDIHVRQRDAEEVFAEIGLIKYPPTLLIAGDAMVLVEFNNENADLKIERPYLGLAPSSIKSFIVSNCPITILSVENLTTFHELAAVKESPKNHILLYTGGMPSPSWKRVYRLLLGVLPSGSRIFHWGDIDAGGFRIASHLAECCRAAGKRLELHMMNLTAHPFSSQDAVRRYLTAREVKEIEQICKQWDWLPQFEWVSGNPLAIEQESLPVTWP